MTADIHELELRREPATGLWVFDDEERGLCAEPLMHDATDLIDLMLRRLGIEGDRVLVKFSESEFQGHQEALTFVRPGKADGFYYHSPTFAREAFLCGHLLDYFETAPQTLWVRFDPVAQARKGDA